MLKPCYLLLTSLLLTSCVDFTNRFAPTRARRPDNGPDPRGLESFFDMKDAASLQHFAWGVSAAAFDGEKRKIEARAALRFRITDPNGLKFSADLHSPLPQTVRFKVNARILGELEANGDCHFEAPTNASDFVPAEAVLVEIESPNELSLRRAGFLKP
jgi:hypothetical protein